MELLNKPSRNRKVGASHRFTHNATPANVPQDLVCRYFPAIHVLLRCRELTTIVRWPYGRGLSADSRTTIVKGSDSMPFIVVCSFQCWCGSLHPSEVRTLQQFQSVVYTFPFPSRGLMSTVLEHLCTVYQASTSLHLCAREPCIIASAADVCDCEPSFTAISVRFWRIGILSLGERQIDVCGWQR